MTMTVMMIEVMTNTIVNNMYLPIRGTALEVEGINSTMTSRNTVKDSRTEMLRVIFSPAMQKPTKNQSKNNNKNCCSCHSVQSIYLRRLDVDNGYSHQYRCVHLEGYDLSQHPEQ